jgi:hypothetical protein
MISNNIYYFFISDYFNTAIGAIFFIIPILLICIFILMAKRINNFIIFCFIFLLISIFFAKGVHVPLGGVYIFMMQHIPLFEVLKTPFEKWGVLVIFFISLLLAISIEASQKNKYKIFFLTCIIFYLAFCLIPFVTNNFIPDYKIDGIGNASRHYTDKSEYILTRNELNSDQDTYRLLSLPGSINYQVALKMHDDVYYTGLDPLLYNINKPFIAAYSDTILAQYDGLFTTISNRNYLKLLSLYNIKKIVINKDMYPWFGYKESESIDEIEKKFDSLLPSEKNGSIIIYDNNKTYLPRIYSTQNITIINGNNTEMISYILSEDYHVSDGVLLKEDSNPNLINQIKKSEINSSSNAYKVNNLMVSPIFIGNYTTIHLSSEKPAITFQRVNPTKYELSINASQPFILIFAESYDENWNIYSDENTFSFGRINYVDNMIGVKEATNNQFTSIEDINYLFIKPVLETDHFKINNYANAWYVDPTLLKRDSNGNCRITIYYIPQSVFYLGTLITILTSLVCIFIILKLKKNN